MADNTKIAAGLSGAQRKVLMGKPSRGDLMRTFRSLEAQGLMVIGDCAHGGIRHTPFGLAVRAELEKNDDR